LIQQRIKGLSVLGTLQNFCFLIYQGSPAISWG